ncbi:MAG TPA: GNAT family N-acetyltransferase [Patescibacteria group bacterium]|nr:GNAT family N-acetyltransferase [Patescibacteria group bacterium]
MSVKIGVSEGIGESQIKELVDYSSSDPLIVKFTHDATRFKNIEAFKKWKTEKFIYTLSSSKDKLLGIVWFGKKNHPKAEGLPFTFAIRIYKPARGQGLSKKLMKSAFDKFIKTDLYQSSVKKGFWLLTRKDNEFAIKLYTNFGFKKILTDKDGYILMILSI